MGFKSITYFTILYNLYFSTVNSHRETLDIKEVDKRYTNFGIVSAVKLHELYIFDLKNDSKISTSFSTIASAKVIEDNKKSGWIYQMIETNENYDDVLQAYWGGYLEVFTTLKYVDATMTNFKFKSFCFNKQSYCSILNNTLHENIQWMKKNVLKYRSTDPFWHQVELQLWYIRGLQDAYVGKRIGNSDELSTAAFMNLQIDALGIYLLQIFEDHEDIEVVLTGRDRIFTAEADHCSALIKLLPGNKDIYTSHVTWTEYRSMLRIIKHYDMPFHKVAMKGSPVVPGRVISFSSVPGRCHSADDFYTLSSELVVIETSITYSNKTLDEIVKRSLNSSVFTYMRAMVANRLSDSGEEWVQHFSRYNSGTYNNHWMIIDYKRFTSGQPIQPGTLTIAEQLPGRVLSSDESNALEKFGYWASYNIPYYPDVYRVTGYEEMAQQYPIVFDYSTSSRALIFRRDQNKVTDLKSMMRLMRSNDFRHDPLSHCNCSPPYAPNLVISARFDLFEPNGTYPMMFMRRIGLGATDMKLINSSMVKEGHFIAIIGPPYDKVPPFQWSKFELGRNISHVLHVDKFEFPPVITPFTMKTKKNFTINV